MVSIYVNGRGWVMSWSKSKGFKFSKYRGSASQYPLDKVDSVRYAIETTIQCNYDIVRCA